MSAEQAARQNIDKLLQEAGWHVCSVAAADLHAARGVAIREFPLSTGFGFADYMLYVDGQAVGVIEAKKASATLTGLEDQSGKYAQGLPSLSGILCVRHTMLSERRRYAKASQEDAEGQRRRAGRGVAEDSARIA